MDTIRSAKFVVVSDINDGNKAKLEETICENLNLGPTSAEKPESIADRSMAGRFIGSVNCASGNFTLKNTRLKKPFIMPLFEANFHL